MAVILEERLALDITETNPADLGLPFMVHKLRTNDAGDLKRTFADGNTDQTQNAVFSDTRTLTAAPQTLDLAGGITSVLTGATITMTTLRGIFVRNKSTTSGENLTIGGGANPLFTNLFGSGTDQIIVPPGGVFYWEAPIDGATVTAGTGDSLDFDPGAATFDFDVAVWGVE